MAVNDLYELVDRQQYLGRDVYNVYHFWQADSVTATSEAFTSRIAAGFEATILPLITACQSNALTHVELYCRNLFTPAEATQRLISVSGSRSFPVGGDYLPPWDAASLSFDTASAIFRRAAKRYAGLFENDQTQGILNNPGLITALTNLGAGLVAGFSVPGGSGPVDFRFASVKRVRFTEDGVVRYRLPNSFAEAAFSVWSSFRIPLELKTQDSRKDY